MKTLTQFSVAVCLLLVTFAGESFAQGRFAQGRSAQGYGGQRGGRGQAMRGQGGQNGFGRGQQMRGMGQQCWRGGASAGQTGNTGQGSMGQGWMRQRRGAGQSGFGNRGNTGVSSGPLSQQEIESILLMREEEKLARDVYVTLGKVWNVRIFANIARAESRHMAAIARLIQNHGLKDPIVDDTTGVFTNSTFAQLYQDLVHAGSASLMDAYAVGVKIEELDIADLEEGSTAVTHGDVQRVYQNLLRGSQNHLRAFTSQL